MRQRCAKAPLGCLLLAAASARPLGGTDLPASWPIGTPPCVLKCAASPKKENTPGGAKAQDLQQAFQTALQDKRGFERIQARALRLAEDLPDQPGAHVLLGQLYIHLADWPKAYEAWQRAAELEPTAYEILKMSGFSAAKLGRLDEAETHYRAALETAGPQADEKAHASLGRILLTQGRADLAQQSFEKALEAPGVGDKFNMKHAGYAGLANVAVIRGDFDTAQAYIDRAIRFAGLDGDADDTAYYIQKARIFMDAGRDDQAVVMLADTWQRFPEASLRIESAILRATLYERSGQIEQAVNHIAYVCDAQLRKPDRIDKKAAEFVALLAEWQIKAERDDAAAVSLENLRSLDPAHPALDQLTLPLP